ncbi:MAG: hypothetical protein IRZ11_04925 [Clostridia bacterium]|nr:hypothetical protein [Clostridia bacterium]
MEMEAPGRRLSLVLAPRAEGGRARGIDVRLRLLGVSLAEGDTLLEMPLEIVSIPTAAYGEGAIAAEDALGPLRLAPFDRPPTPSGRVREWRAGRATSGEIVVTYHAPPRAVSAETRPGPYFDLRAEGGSLLGAGITFLALPPDGPAWEIELGWDLSGLPPGSLGVTSRGEGDLAFRGPTSSLTYCAYAAGPLRAWPEDGAGDLRLYALSPTPFPADRVAATLSRLYAFMCRFFEEPEPEGYRVFVRRNPYPGTGGTAFPRSFIFGYGEGESPAPDELTLLLAHEMVHNWPSLERGVEALAWYNEGTAEYYSLALLHRMGALDSESFAREATRRAIAYATNPLQSLSMEEAARIYWQNPLAQRVPYHRGFMYLAALDAKLRRTSSGRRSLDDLVLALLRRKREGEPYGEAAWRELVEGALGAEGLWDYEAMMRGEPVAPPEDALGPALRLEPCEAPAFDFGFDLASFLDPERRVRGLRPGSNAERAGLREGDRILLTPGLSEALGDPEREIELGIVRGETRLWVRYLPRGRPVPAFRFRPAR